MKQKQIAEILAASLEQLRQQALRDTAEAATQPEVQP